MIHLSKISHYKTGGTCQKLYAPTTVSEVQIAMREIAERQLPFYILGGGTNSLVTDEHWPGAVLSLHALRGVEVRNDRIRCMAGEINSDIAELAYTHKLAGAAWMNGLPGQIGGTVRMNARCYGGEISQITTHVTTVDASGQIKEYTQPKQVFRGYKDTVFMEVPEVVVACELQLQVGDPQTIRQKMDFCLSDRQSKQQFIYPNCGCVFKNCYAPDVSMSSGILLEAAGVKGMRVGQAIVSSAHANFVYNLGGATSDDILTLSSLMREHVWTEFGVWLEYEMEVLGTRSPRWQAYLTEQRSPQYKTERLAELRTNKNPK